MTRMIPVKSSTDACAPGNPFLYISRKLNNKIYKHIIADHTKVRHLKQRNGSLDTMEIMMANTK